MTLCIAAECEYRGVPAIALCADWRGQTGDINHPDGLIGTDDSYKMRLFGSATVLLAGNQARAIELAVACKGAIAEFCQLQVEPMDLDVAVTRFLEDLKVIARDKKKGMIRNFIESATGVDFSDFIKLPRDQHLDMWNRMEQINLGADIIIAHVKSEQILVRVDRWGNVSWEGSYAIVGSGSEAARSMLCLQMWNHSVDHGSDSYQQLPVPLEECLFRLNEANYVSHKANPSSVGDVVTYQILTAKHRCSVRHGYMNTLSAVLHNKHKIPRIERVEAKNAVLSYFQSFDQGAESATEEPENL